VFGIVQSDVCEYAVVTSSSWSVYRPDCEISIYCHVVRRPTCTIQVERTRVTGALVGSSLVP
jgi:hypothetical protein